MTQKEIAKTLNISISTVSRALKGSSLIGKETVRKVKNLASITKYRPNPLARNLLTGKTYTVGIIFSFDDFFFRELTFRISRKFLSNDYMGIFLSCKTEAEHLEATEKLFAKHVDGIISCSASSDLTLKFKNENTPVVFYGNDSLPFDYVGVDKYKGGRISAEYITEKGHRKIAYIGFNLKDERAKAFLDVMREKNIALHDEWIFKGNISMQAAEQATAKILTSKNLPSVIVAHNDIAAIAAIKTISEKGLRIPDDIAVIGFNNIDISAYSNPPLTTIDQKMDLLAENLVETLMHRIKFKESDDYRNITIEPELVIRSSC